MALRSLGKLTYMPTCARRSRGVFASVTRLGWLPTTRCFSSSGALRPKLLRFPSVTALTGTRSWGQLRAYSTTGKPLTHYDVLRITPPSNPSEIKQAYFRRVKECHPDIHGDSKTAEFQRLTAAYTVRAPPRSCGDMPCSS
jgi:hypothetical protein